MEILVIIAVAVLVLLAIVPSNSLRLACFAYCDALKNKKKLEYTCYDDEADELLVLPKPKKTPVRKLRRKIAGVLAWLYRKILSALTLVSRLLGHRRAT